MAYGQIGAAAEVLEPKEGGFSKRFHITFANFKGNYDPDQPADVSGNGTSDGGSEAPVARRARPSESPVPENTDGDADGTAATAAS